MNLLLRLMFKLMNDAIKIIEFIDAKIVHGRGSSFFWGISSTCVSAFNFFLLCAHSQRKIEQVVIVMLFFLAMIGLGLSDKRNDDLKQKQLKIISIISTGISSKTNLFFIKMTLTSYDS